MSSDPADPSTRAARSRDNHLTLRRVERQHRLVELLATASTPLASGTVARELGVGLRTVERDLARLREAGVPIESVPGAGGGSRFRCRTDPPPVALSFTEVAALVASLVALGPTATDSAASAMQALLAALAPRS